MTRNIHSYLSKEFRNRIAVVKNYAFSQNIVGYLVTMPQFSSTATWGGGSVNAILGGINNILNMGNTIFSDKGAAIKSATILEWQGSAPVTISLSMIFHYDQPTGYHGNSLAINMQELTKLTLPSGSAPSINQTEWGKDVTTAVKKFGEYTPAPQKMINAIVDAIGNFSSGQRAPAGFRVDFGTSSRIDILMRDGLAGLSGLDIIQNKQLVLSIPRKWLITDSVTFSTSNQMDAAGGLRWIKADIQMKTFIAPTAAVFGTWLFPFVQPNSTDLVTIDTAS